MKIRLYKAITLSVMLYSFETLSLTLREKHRLREFKNRIFRRITEPKRDDIGDWRRLHNEELHSLYRLTNIVRVINLED